MPVANIDLPAELLDDIDKEIAPDQKEAFLTAAIQAELRRRRLLDFISDARREPAWKDEDHPELADGTAAWVRKIRAEGESRMRDVEAAWQRE